jgi:hypothetical protein
VQAVGRKVYAGFRTPHKRPPESLRVTADEGTPPHGFSERQKILKVLHIIHQYLHHLIALFQPPYCTTVNGWCYFCLPKLGSAATVIVPGIFGEAPINLGCGLRSRKANTRRSKLRTYRSVCGPSAHPQHANLITLTWKSLIGDLSEPFQISLEVPKD